MNNRELIDYLVAYGIQENASDIAVLAELEPRFGHIGLKKLVMCALESGYAVKPRKESMLLYFERVI